MQDPGGPWTHFHGLSELPEILRVDQDSNSSAKPPKMIRGWLIDTERFRDMIKADKEYREWDSQHYNILGQHHPFGISGSLESNLKSYVEAKCFMRFGA